mmetsp:Transcript_71581/g.125983  ORF Transcript_71581/g.125983 Transcript_71581/m.125983 type:complete len:242 (+) Transcript_71581:6051-6776(+)
MPRIGRDQLSEGTKARDCPPVVLPDAADGLHLGLCCGHFRCRGSAAVQVPILGLHPDIRLQPIGGALDPVEEPAGAGVGVRVPRVAPAHRPVRGLIQLLRHAPVVGPGWGLVNPGLGRGGVDVDGQRLHQHHFLLLEDHNVHLFLEPALHDRSGNLCLEEHVWDPPVPPFVHEVGGGVLQVVHGLEPGLAGVQKRGGPGAAAAAAAALAAAAVVGVVFVMVIGHEGFDRGRQRPTGLLDLH